MADDGIAPNATVYVRNLEEKIKIPALIEALREIFGEVGEVVDIVAKKNLKAKGQAFIVFESAELAQNAIDDLQGFELFGKPMQLAFAKTRSDITVKREEGEEALDLHKRHRLAEKDRKQAQEAAEQQKHSNKRAAPDALAERPAKSKPGVPSTSGAGASAGAGAAGAVPDEFLPPNKTLVLRELPQTYTKDQLTELFARYPGFREVRMVPGRAGIAFAEYDDEGGAISAKEAMNGEVLADKTIRVTYQRQ